MPKWLFDQDTWRFINTFAPWLSAIGTLAAVLVSLRLARSRTKVRVQFIVDVRFILEHDGRQYEKRDEDYISFWVTNVGEPEVAITTIGWLGRPGFTRRYAMQHPDDGPYAGQKLPLRLKFGEEARLLVRLEEHWLDGIVDGMIGRFPWLSAQSLRAVAWTSVGQSFKVKPDPKLLARVIAHASERRKSLKIAD